MVKHGGDSIMLWGSFSSADTMENLLSSTSLGESLYLGLQRDMFPSTKSLLAHCPVDTTY